MRSKTGYVELIACGLIWGSIGVLVKEIDVSAPVIVFFRLALGAGSVFANSIYHFTPEFGAAIEYQRLQTKPLVDGIRKNDHLNLTFVYSF